jgi:hypothetical protein
MGKPKLLPGTSDAQACSVGAEAIAGESLGLVIRREERLDPKLLGSDVEGRADRGHHREEAEPQRLLPKLDRVER